MRVKMTLVAAALAGLLTMLLSSGTAAADVINVSPGESIQAAIDKADPYDTIKIAPGTYNESVLIKTNGIQLVGSGRKSTKIVPPANLVEGQGCVFSEQRDPPPAPPVIVANGICVANFDAQGNTISDVEDVHISRLAVSGFNGVGIQYFGAKDAVVERVLAENNDEYGIFVNTTSGSYIARNITPHNGEAGVYVGDSPHADATVWRNVSWDNNIGVFIRDVAHGKVLDNKTFANCAGVLFLNTDETTNQPPGEPIDIEDWLAKGNDATANSKACGGGGDEPPFSGVGIAVVSGSNVRLIDNGAFGNLPAQGSNPPFHGGIVVVGDPTFKPSAGVKVGFNTAFGNDPDLFWDQQGQGNSFFGNDCLTSQPDGLCEDPGDRSDHGNNGDSSNNDNHQGKDGGHGKKGAHGHHKKHKKHKKHGTSHKQKRG